MMRNLILGVTASAMLAVPTVVMADVPVFQAIQLRDEDIRYDRGVPTIEVERQNGAVQIQPLPMDHGSYAFSVAVFNAGNLPANIDISSFSIQIGSRTVGVMDVNRLVRKAKSRSAWSQFGVGLLGVLGSAAAASERDSYSGTMYTPYGTYHSYYSAPSVAGQLQAERIEELTSERLANMQDQLDATRAALSNNIIQMTTVEAGRGYAGEVILQKVSVNSLPQQLNITVNWNGEEYPFSFQLAKPGTPPPSYTPTARSARANPHLGGYALANTQTAHPPIPSAVAANATVPPDVNMVGIVKRTAEYMRRPTVLDSGTKLTQFKASGTQLAITAEAASSKVAEADSWRAAANSEICAARPFSSIIFQGGSVRASYVGPRKRELGTIEVTNETCRVGLASS